MIKFIEVTKKHYSGALNLHYNVNITKARSKSYNYEGVRIGFRNRTGESLQDDICAVVMEIDDETNKHTLYLVPLHILKAQYDDETLDCIKVYHINNTDQTKYIRVFSEELNKFIENGNLLGLHNLERVSGNDKDGWFKIV